METKRFFQIEIILNGLVSSFRFIWIPMLWVNGHYKYSYSYSAGIDFRRQNLTTKVDPRAERVKLISMVCIKLISALGVEDRQRAVWYGIREVTPACEGDK